MYFERCWERITELTEPKSFREFQEFEEILKGVCKLYEYYQEKYGYSDLVNLYFTTYYGCPVTLYYDHPTTDWILVSVDDYYLEVDILQYTEDLDDEEPVSCKTVKYPKLFFNTVQYEKWKKWAFEISVHRLTEEKEKLLKDIETLYTRYKKTETSLNNLTINN